MTDRLDVGRRRDVVARWCTLAEQRLEFLNELFESGRWRRYHSELAFLENIREAKATVELWRDLLRLEAVAGDTRIEIGTHPPSGMTILPERSVHPAHRQLTEPLHVAASEPDNGFPIAFENPARDQPSSAVPRNMVELTLDIDGISESYPIARSAP